MTTEKNLNTTDSTGLKFDGEKPMWWLMPEQAEKEIVDVLTYGAKKYSPDNWKKVPDLQNRYYSAMRRHIYAFRNGERRDPETNMHHLAHAACCVLFMMQADLDQENAE